jgi:hypothetical protein
MRLSTIPGRVWTTAACGPVLSAILLTTASGARAANGTYLENSTLYPRLVRLDHGSAATNGQIVASTNGRIFVSTDGGTSFAYLGKVPVISGSTEHCCGTLFELPQQVGSLAAGTLLYAASYYVGSSRAIEAYTSSDQGQSWSYSSTPVSGGDSSHGFWEPQFTIANDGAHRPVFRARPHQCVEPFRSLDQRGTVARRPVLYESSGALSSPERTGVVREYQPGRLGRLVHDRGPGPGPDRLQRPLSKLFLSTVARRGRIEHSRDGLGLQ